MSTGSNRSVTGFAANAATVLFALTIVLQLLLAAGILPVSMSWGGRQTVLTPGLRLASVAAAVILGGFAYVIRRRAGLMGTLPPPLAIKILSWFITAYMAFNTLGNLTSVSATERLVFTPITVLLVVACFVVSRSKV